MYRNLASLGISALAFHHELAQPLARIGGYLEELLKRWDKMNDEKKLDYIEKSQKDTWIIDDLNSYIKEFAALFKGAKGSKRKKEKIDIESTIIRLEDGFRNLLEGRKVSIEHYPGPGSFKNLYMNPASLESILVNLISNSIRALFQVKRSKKSIVIDYKKNLGKLEIRITDNGCGIEEGDKEKIFRPFWTTFKGDAQKGTGMGMTIVREIISDDYGGTVYVEKSTPESSNPGRGKTTMLIKIPLEFLENPNS
jgi:signal transduction histidine kinase